MKFSVVIPIYNGSKYIRETIESIINQPYKNIEIICVDDGSTDISSEIINEMVQLDNRIRYFYKKNEGVHSARNMGIQLASGKYLTFLDQDDLWIEGAIDDSFINKLENNGCDFYKCSYYEVNETVTRCKKVMLEDTTILDIEKSQMQHHSSYVFSTSFLRKNKIFTDEYRCEDWRFLMRCYAYAKNGKTISKPFFLYRNNSNSVSHQSDKNRAIESSLKGFLLLSETTNNHFLKHSSSIWAIGVIFQLIDEISLHKKAKNDIIQVCSRYKLDDLVREYWVSDKNKKKYILLKNNVNRYIFRSRIKGYINILCYHISRIRAIKKIYDKKKYPVVYRR